MKNTVLLFLYLLVVSISYAQLGTGENTFNFTNELQRFASIPNSPEAEAFAKYGNTPVNLYTGTTNVGIPIYTYQGREMNLPISLTYDASGIKVGQMATNVGLGWNLSVGGRISRNVNGLPDDYFDVAGAYQTLYDPLVRQRVASYINTTNTREFDTEEEMNTYLNFIKDVSENHIDTQGDYYSLNVMGLNETIVLNVNNNLNPVAVNNPRIRIEKTHGNNNSLDSWIVYSDDGTKFFFAVAEETIIRQDPIVVGTGSNIINKHNSSWLLTRIESPNKKDIYEFEYIDYGFWLQEPVGYSAAVAINTIEPNQTNYLGPDESSTVSLPYSIKQQFLTAIKHNGDVIASYTLGDREDTDDRAKKVDHITITDYLGNQVQKVTFDYSYFGDVTSTDVFDKRLKLDKVSFSGTLDTSDEHEFTFDYIQPENIPSRLSLARDIYGYYNGADSNMELYPYYNDGTNIFQGANRAPNAFEAQIGLLSKITYPTKGYTSFEYEGHTAYKQIPEDVTESILSLTVNPWDVVDPNDFVYDDGSICDDEFVGVGYPRFKTTMFVIPDTPGNISYQMLGSNLRYAAIAQIGTIDQVTIVDEDTGLFFYSGTDTYKDYCDFYSQPNIWDSREQNINTSFTIAPGVYKAMILSEEGTNTVSNLSLLQGTTSLIGQNVDVGGVRVKRVQDFASDQKLAATREFSYENENDHSTGVLQYEPLFIETKAVRRFQFASDWGNGTIQYQLHRNSFSSTTADGPHITYNTVREYKVDSNGTPNGYTQYTFEQQKEGAVSRGGYPFQSDFFGGTLSGSSKEQQVVSQDGDVLTKSTTDVYVREQIFLNRNLVVYTDSELMNHRLGLYVHPTTGKYTYEVLVPSICSAVDLGSSPILGDQLCVDQTAVEGANYIGVTNSSYGRLKVTNVSAQGEITAPIVTTNIETFKGVDVATTTTYQYDSDLGYLLREMEVDQHGKKLNTRYVYPKDVAGGLGDVYSAMITANRLTEKIRTERYEEDTKLSTRNTVFKQYDGSNILPYRIQTLKGTTIDGSGTLDQETYEDRMVIHSYDEFGNPNEISQANGNHSIFIWGYKNKYPIAKIDNATYDDMPSTVTDLIDQIRTETDTENSEAGEAYIRTLFDSLRAEEFFKKSQITTYTYDPMVGITSMTDPRGYVSYYKYDVYNRLIQVQDKDKNILSENEYHHKNN